MSRQISAADLLSFRRALRTPRTARQLAAHTGLSKPTVYERIKTLEEDGAQIVTSKAREGLRGPKSVIYCLPG